MNRTIGAGLVVAGVVLLAAGLRSSDSAVSQLSQAFNGHPTHETSLLIAAGIAGIGLGAWSLFKPKNKA